MLRTAASIVIIWMSMLTGTAVAGDGDRAEVVLVSDQVSLDSHNDGSTGLKVSLINLTGQQLRLSASPVGASEGCRIEPEQTVLKPSRQTEIKMVAKGCELSGKQDFPLQVRAGGTTFPVTASRAEPSHPNWTILWAFPAALAVALITAAVSYRAWLYKETEKKAFDMGRKLRYLTDSWKFTDSWASNVTVFAAAFSALFGTSEALTALGDDNKEVLALITVAAAIAVGVASAAPLLVQALREDGVVTTGGVLAGAVVTLAATGGQLAVIVIAAQDLNLGGSQDIWLPTVGVLAGALLVYYADRSLRQNLTMGVTAPPAGKREPSAVI